MLLKAMPVYYLLCFFFTMAHNWLHDFSDGPVHLAQNCMINRWTPDVAVFGSFLVQFTSAALFSPPKDSNARSKRFAVINFANDAIASLFR